MKRIFALIAVLLIAGCAAEPEAGEQAPESPEIPEGFECATDNHCAKGGCSGEVCQAKSEPPVVSVCEYREEFECFKLTSCRCIGGMCRWENNSAYLECAG